MTITPQSQVVSREYLCAATPRGTNTWYSLSPGAIVDAVEKQLSAHGFTVEAERRALSHEGARYFGALSMSLPTRGE